MVLPTDPRVGDGVLGASRLRAVILALSMLSAVGCGAAPHARAVAVTASLPAGGASWRVSPEDRVLRDPTYARMGGARSFPLLVVVVQQTEQLLRAEPANAAARPILDGRLAEDYVELEIRAQIDGKPTVALAARRQAVKHCTAALAESHDPLRLPELLYARGLEREADGDDADALADYQTILTRYPSTWSAPYAAYGMGVITRRDAPDLRDLARHYFEQAEERAPSPLAEAARVAAE